jgi:hypothetical protein
MPLIQQAHLGNDVTNAGGCLPQSGTGAWAAVHHSTCRSLEAELVHQLLFFLLLRHDVQAEAACTQAWLSATLVPLPQP